ncbi:hypothetical protein LY90DRAFT_665908 [Neocallimastix californiae]|jgi:cobalamin biosynthesis Mg chelatase CobN|uniref:Extracellular membrane protein CFEM domain-containing protein n=1 Tax=Neocallimastix californiae TaxID=1754190 RepID=A0A1Y2EUC9_9FUNG|nr:hypothetical protein LY90DRAFT_665908 [Neocallimastix californiae]|eukprot:ORY75168.1 hypothetical protein LY90DRAFT_665908 [Neocallimastix californiae]
MKFNYVLLAAAAALAVSAETAEECVKSKNCGDDVVCIAHCFNVPAPTVQQVNNVESCISKCDGSISCYNNCIDTEFLGAGSGAAAAAAGAAAGTATDAANTAANAANGAAATATEAAGAAATSAVNAANNTVVAANNTANAVNNTANATVSAASPRTAITGLVGLVCSTLYFLF